MSRINKLSPIIKWPGGKEKELSFILPNAPQFSGSYYEPFVGGGAVFTAVSAQKYFINDKSEELINLYRCIASLDKGFYTWLDVIDTVWSAMLAFVDGHRDLCHSYLLFRGGEISDREMEALIIEFVDKNSVELDTILASAFHWKRDVYIKELHKNLSRKIFRMNKIERVKGFMPPEDVYDNIETAFMSSIYMYFRCLYNDKELMLSDRGLGTAIFVFIRNYAYGGMFRYSQKGEFNVPYGGIGYNHKHLEKRVGYYKYLPLIEHLNNTDVCNQDFEVFFRANPPQEDDFVFLDPPYDSEFSTYAQNTFSRDDHRRLADYLIRECQAKWMMVIKYTPFIFSLYDGGGLTIKTFDKRYLVSFMNRNDQMAEHLIIMNY